MNDKNKDIVCIDEIKSLSMSGQAESPQIMRALSFSEIIENVRSLIETERFPYPQRRQAEEICLIIAEIFNMPPDAKVRINGNDLTAEMVKVIYQHLEHEHIQLVIENYEKVAYEIKHKKTYLRTALYNVVFEYESHWANQFAKDFGGECGG